MFTKLSAALTIAALALTAGLTGTAPAASHARAADTGAVRLAQLMPPIIPQVPTFPQPPITLPVLPIQPSLTPALPACPAPQPQPAAAQPAAAASLAFTGNDDGCVLPRTPKFQHPAPSQNALANLSLA